MNIHSVVQADFVALADRLRNWYAALPLEAQRSLAETVEELQHRLIRLAGTYDRLIKLNETLIDRTGTSVSFNPETDTLAMVVDGKVAASVRLKRANPQVPVTLLGTHLISSFTSGAVESEPWHRLPSDEKLELEDKLESFYYGAHRALKLFQKLPGMRNVKAKGVLLVRNKLIEHADYSTRYSFGFGTGGPRVRPHGKVGRDVLDQGLEANALEFVQAIRKALGDTSSR